MRLLQCVNAYTAIQSMMSDDLDYQTAYALVVLKKRLLPHVEFYRKEELKLVDCYAAKDEKGKILWTDSNRFGFKDPQLAEEYATKFNDLCAVIVQWKYEPLIVPIPERIKPSVLEALDGFLSFEDSTDEN